MSRAFIIAASLVTSSTSSTDLIIFILDGQLSDLSHQSLHNQCFHETVKKCHFHTFVLHQFSMICLSLCFSYPKLSMPSSKLVITVKLLKYLTRSLFIVIHRYCMGFFEIHTSGAQLADIFDAIWYFITF